MNRPPNLEGLGTERLRTSRLTEADGDDLSAFFVANDVPETTRLFHPFPLTEATARRLASAGGGDHFFATRLDGRIVAFSMLRGFDEGFDIPSFGILVDRHHRGCGIGRAVTEAAAAAAVRLGCDRIRLTVEPENTTARRLYADVGFEDGPDHTMWLNLTGDIPVSAPDLNGAELEYVTDAVRSSWISSIGPYVDRFERDFARFVNVEHAVACTNGTAALHLALLAAGVQPGDEVLVPALTYVAAVNAIAYCGAKPVLVDVCPDTWTIDPSACAAAITPATSAILAVHLYGHPADMDALASITQKSGILLVEDAAESHGATVRGRPVGGLGRVGAFSFFGNKIISTGEGGMVVTNDSDIAAQARLLRGQGMDPDRRYWHVVRGYNYRMTNVTAAIGVAQMERAKSLVEQRRTIAHWYAEELEGVEGVTLQHQQPWADSAHWMVSVILDGASAAGRDHVIRNLAARRIETRPFFPAVHHFPMYADLSENGSLPVAERLAGNGLSLPTFNSLRRRDVTRVVRDLCEAMADAAA